MIEKNKMTMNNKQFKALLVCSTWPTIINYGSGLLARQVGRDMWISGILGVLTSLLFVVICIKISQSFPGKTIVEYSKDLFTTIPGKLLGILFTAYFFIGAANGIAMYIHHLTDFLLPETPFIVVTILHVAVVSYLAWKGPEVIGRVAVLAFALAILFHTLVLLASLSEINFKRLLPVFDSGVLPVASASLGVDSFTGIDQIIVLMLLPMVNNQKKAMRSAAAGITIGGSLFVFYFIVELMVMGPQVVALMRIASMDFVRSIQITQYLHRFESFMVALWYWSMLVQEGIAAYCSQKALIQTIGIKRRKTKNILAVVFGLLLVIMVYLIGYDRVFFLNYREVTWVNFSVPIQFGLPVLLLIALAIKKAVKAVREK